MNDSVLIVLVLGAVVILAVLAYNVYQENKYRKQLRDQFGHANKDALLDSQVDSVRDGHSSQLLSKEKAEPLEGSSGFQAAESAVVTASEAATAEAVSDSKPVIPEADSDMQSVKLQHETAENATVSSVADVSSSGKRKPLLDVQDMAKQPLPWFDVRFDYLAYIALYEPKELHMMPRLSSRYRFRLVGCTLDDRFQIAEPIPSVYYQGFVLGLQAINRTGLAASDELAQFGEQVMKFATKLDGQVLLTDIDTFLTVAQPLDELCARVDQTIAIHLVSRTSLSGMELRMGLEQHGFELAADGAFYLTDALGNILFSVVTLDNTPFTSTLLANQNYRGFSMLFDVVHVGHGEKYFDQFMDIAVKLSSQLGVDLVNDKVEELSTQWLREVRRYVIERQKEMKQVEIEPGSELAKRLFS